jgi:hypothetical protein
MRASVLPWLAKHAPFYDLKWTSPAEKYEWEDCSDVYRRERFAILELTFVGNNAGIGSVLAAQRIWS